MKPFTRLSFAFLIVFATVATLFMLAKVHPIAADAADDFTGGTVNQVDPIAKVAKVDPIETDKGLLIGQVYGKYGTVCIYDNGKYRWAEIVEKSVVTVYGPGQKRQDITIELDEPAPVTVTTTRWGKVYTDPRLVAGWIDG